MIAHTENLSAELIGPAEAAKLLGVSRTAFHGLRATERFAPRDNRFMRSEMEKGGGVGLDCCKMSAFESMDLARRPTI